MKEGSLCFLPISMYIALYLYVSSTVQRKNRNTDFPYTYIYFPFFCLFVFCLFVFCFVFLSKSSLLDEKKGIYIFNRYFQIWSIFENGFIYIINIYTFFP